MGGAGYEVGGAGDEVGRAAGVREGSLADDSLLPSPISSKSYD